MTSSFARFLNSGGSKRPVLLKYRASKTYIVLTVAISIFSDLFLYGVIVPVVPWALHTRAGVPEEHTQYWVSILLSVYGAALLAGSPIAGYISDITPSRRLPFLCGLALLIGATAMLCVADSIALFILGRVLQGLSSSIVWVAGLVIIVDTAGQKDVGQYMGYTGLSMSLAILLAPLLGGVVYDRAGYYAVFAMCFALLGVDVIMRITMIERQVAAKWIDFDAQAKEKLQEDAGADGNQAQLGVADLEKSQKIPTSKQQQTELTRNRDVDECRVASPALADLPSRKILIATAPKSKWYNRLPPVITLLKSRRLLASLWGSIIQATLLTSLDSTIPLRVRAIFGWDSLGAGLIFLPIVLPSFAGPFIGWVSDRYGPKWPATMGFLGAVPCAVLLRFVDYNSIHQKVLLCVLLALLGFCISIVLTPFMAEIAYVVEEKERKTPGLFGAKGAYAQAYGLFNVAFAAGCLIGPIWGGLVKEKAGWNTMVWTLGLLSGFSAFVTLGWCGGWIGDVGMNGGGGHGGAQAKERAANAEEKV